MPSPEFNKWPDIQNQSVWKKTEFSDSNKDLCVIDGEEEILCIKNLSCIRSNINLFKHSTGMR